MLVFKTWCAILNDPEFVEGESKDKVQKGEFRAIRRLCRNGDSGVSWISPETDHTLIPLQDMKDRKFELPPLLIDPFLYETEPGENPQKREEVEPAQKNQVTSILNQTLFLTQRFYTFLEKFYPTCQKCGKKMFPNFCGIYTCTCQKNLTSTFISGYTKS